jgi:hypothetical protein
MKTRISFRAFVVAGLIVVASSAEARDFSLWIGGNGMYFFTSEVDPVVAHRKVGGTMVRGGVELIKGLTLEAEWRRIGTSAWLFRSYKTTLTAHWVSLGARYRVPVFEWFEPYARAGGGLAIADLGLTASDGAR